MVASWADTLADMRAALTVDTMAVARAELMVGVLVGK
jgi:hypothetical protein